MARALGFVAGLILLLAAPAAIEAQTKDLTFRFTDAKAAGKLKITFVSQNFATFGVTVEVDIPANTMAAAKRDLVMKAIQDEFKKQLPNDDVAKAFTYSKEMNPPAGTEGLIMGNIPIMIGKTLFGLNARLNSGKTKEGRDGLITSALDQSEWGFIRFAAASYDPDDDGALALFHAGVFLDGTLYAADLFATSLGSPLSAGEIAHDLWLALEDQISAFAYFPDPALNDSDTLLIKLFAVPQFEFGVEFGSTSPSGEVIGGLVANVPGPVPLVVVAFGIAALAALAGRYRLIAVRLDR